MCVAVKICYQFKDLTSSILKHIVIGPEKFKKFHVPKSRQMKSKLFLLIFFYNQWATKTTVEWILPGLKQNFWRVRILSNMIWCGGEAKSCFQNPNFVIYCIIIPIESDTTWFLKPGSFGALVCVINS